MNEAAGGVGSRVRAELALRGLGTKDLARHLGVADATAHRRLRGTTQFDARELASLSTWLDVPVSRFFEPLPRVRLIEAAS